MRWTLVSLGAVVAACLAAVEPAAAWEPGERIDEALALQLTAAGLDEASGLLPEIVPERTDLADAGADGGFSCVNYVYLLTEGWVGIELVDLGLVPGSGVLDVVADLSVWINDASDPFSLYYELFCAGETCTGYVRPFDVTATIPVSFAVVDRGDGAVLDAIVGEIRIDNRLDGTDIDMSCNLATLETVLNFFGLSIYDLIIGVAEDQLLAQVADLSADLEQTLDDALASGRFEDAIDLGGVPLNVLIEPSGVDITPAGMSVLAAGAAWVDEAAACIAEFDPGESAESPSAVPPVDDLPAATHAAVLASDDFVDQVLYAAWRGGLLCYDLSEQEGLGIPLNSSLLGLLGGPEFGALFEEEGRLDVITRPRAAPTVAWGGDHDLTLEVRDLGLDFYADVDYRMALALGMSIEADVGADLSFDGTTGELGLEVAVDEDAIKAFATGNELAPHLSPEIEAAFEGLMGSILDSLLAPVLGDLAFALPAFDGVGVTDLAVASAGSDADWLAAHASLGPVAYGSGTGCDANGGCDTSGQGCTGGCATVGASPWTALLVLVSLGVARRRRR